MYIHVYMSIHMLKYMYILISTTCACTALTVTHILYMYMYLYTYINTCMYMYMWWHVYKGVESHSAIQIYLDYVHLYAQYMCIKHAYQKCTYLHNILYSGIIGKKHVPYLKSLGLTFSLHVPGLVSLWGCWLCVHWPVDSSIPHEG